MCDIFLISCACSIIVNICRYYSLCTYCNSITFLQLWILIFHLFCVSLLIKVFFLLGLIYASWITQLYILFDFYISCFCVCGSRLHLSYTFYVGALVWDKINYQFTAILTNIFFVSTKPFPCVIYAYKHKNKILCILFLCYCRNV